MRTGKLNVKQVESILSGKVGGRYHGDGGGLWLVVTKRDENGKALAASYVFRFMLYGKSREMGLGSAWDIKLADAREKARVARVRVRIDNADVVEEKRADVKAKRDAAQVEQARRMTFRAVAAQFIRSREGEWKNAKHAWQWGQTIGVANNVMGSIPVADVTTPLIMQVIEPLWLTKTETASRLRGRIEAVLDYARVAGYRTDAENPARWKGHLEHLLPRKSKVAPVEHFEALPYRDVAQFITELRQQGGNAARALEFAILAVARTGSVLQAEWDEFAEDGGRTWHAPAHHMKGPKDHRYPLCKRAIEIIDEMREIAKRRPSKFVFQGLKDGKPLSNMSMLMLLRRMGHPELTVHGFRSTHDDWANEIEHASSELRAMALAHIVSDKVEAAYRRGDMFQQRRRLADQWCRFCATPWIDPIEVENGKVVVLGAA